MFNFLTSATGTVGSIVDGTWLWQIFYKVSYYFTVFNTISHAANDPSN